MKLIADKVCKTIKGKEILSDICLELDRGHIYGFRGKNGSGKTMLFRALSGLMSVTFGTVSWDGKVLKKDFSVLPSLGIVLENVGLYPHFTGFENLKYLAKYRKIAGEQEICSAIERVGLDPKDRRLYGKYSLGMKQRLAIAQAVMEKPDVLMLDEPTNALDDEGVEFVRKILLEEKARGALILIASYNLEELEFLGDEIFHIENGKIV